VHAQDSDTPPTGDEDATKSSETAQTANNTPCIDA
jgi:hypothetical protein